MAFDARPWCHPSIAVRPVVARHDLNLLLSMYNTLTQGGAIHRRDISSAFHVAIPCKAFGILLDPALDLSLEWSELSVSPATGLGIGRTAQIFAHSSAAQLQGPCDFADCVALGGSVYHISVAVVLILHLSSRERAVMVVCCKFRCYQSIRHSVAV